MSADRCPFCGAEMVSEETQLFKHLVGGTSCKDRQISTLRAQLKYREEGVSDFIRQIRGLQAQLAKAQDSLKTFQSILKNPNIVDAILWNAPDDYANLVNRGEL